MKRAILVYFMLYFIAPVAMMAEKKRIKDSNVYWELDSGVLTISGNGAIPDYCGSPWEKEGNVETIIIKDGVTSIGKVNFWEYDKPNYLKYVEIGNTVTSIGEGAFEYCRLLQSIKIGDSVTSIGPEAFNECISLQSVILPSSVKRVKAAFKRCSNLQSIEISGSAPFDELESFAGYSCDKLKIARRILAPDKSEYTLITDINSQKCGLQASNGNWLVNLGKYDKIIPLVGNFLKVKSDVKYGLITFESKEIIPCEMEALESAGTGYLKYKINGFWGVINYAGKIIIDTDRGYTSIGDFKTFNKRFPYTMVGYKGECDINGRQISKIKVETAKQAVASSSSSSSTASGSSSPNSNSNNNSGNKTTTIVVEHQHTPQPVQEWQACFGCGGMGTMGCDNCGGSGTKYIGDRLHRCSRCNGRGIIPCNICYGNKGKYVTVYR